MCRLLGYIARQPVIAEHVLEDTLAAFIELSHLHADGWGLAWYDEQSHVQLAKTPEPAHTSVEFSSLAASIRTDTLIAHVRWATPGFALCIENTHALTCKNSPSRITERSRPMRTWKPRLHHTCGGTLPAQPIASGTFW